MNRDHELLSYAGPEVEDFRKKFASIACSLDCHIPGGAESFFASLECLQLGALNVLKYDGYGLRGRRSFRHIREDVIDDFLVVVPLSVPIAISQSGRTAMVEPGTCALVTTTRPFESLCGTPSGHPYSEFVVRIPGSMLRHLVPYIDECNARPINVHHGAGKILRSLIEVLIDERSDYSKSQADRLGAILLPAVANVALEAPELAELQNPLRKSAHARIFERAKDFIESNLSNPELDPAMVADYCRISVSYLHAAFAASSLNVGATIREMRLLRCREALQNPALRYQSIIEIAMRWGFNSSSRFSRTYRARFGKPPSEDRQVLTLVRQQWFVN